MRAPYRISEGCSASRDPQREGPGCGVNESRYSGIPVIDDEQLGGSRREAGAQVSISFLALMPVIVEALTSDSEGRWFELVWIKVTGRPAYWRASMNDVDASPVSPLPEYLSSCSSGNISKGSPPTSNRRQRDSSSTSPSSMRRVFMFLNKPRSLRHSVR